ncbi:MAG: hypothetical protein R8G66_06135 [Cytophagales bacterium]|nr:hypothetical protein [Cytophagales bacterium]
MLSKAKEETLEVPLDPPDLLLPPDESLHVREAPHPEEPLQKGPLPEEDTGYVGHLPGLLLEEDQQKE